MCPSSSVPVRGSNGQGREAASNCRMCNHCVQGSFLYLNGMATRPVEEVAVKHPVNTFAHALSYNVIESPHPVSNSCQANLEQQAL